MLAKLAVPCCLCPVHNSTTSRTNGMLDRECTAMVVLHMSQASYTHLLELLGQELRRDCWRQDAMQLKNVVQPSNSPAFARIRF